MTTQNYALIDTNGNVTAVIVYDGVSVFTPPTGVTMEPVGISGAGIGWTYANGAFVAPPAAQAPPLTPQQQAYQAIATGLTITSTSTPALNGTYACDSTVTADINAEITSIMLNSVFADGSTAIQWPDAMGTLHAFTITQFKAFATALASYVSGVRRYAAGVTTSLPSNQITIA